MKNFSLKIIIFLLTFFIAYPVYSQQFKKIKLKDGSSLKGRIIKYERKRFTVNTPSLGTIDIPDSNIRSIEEPSDTESTGFKRDKTNDPRHQITRFPEMPGMPLDENQSPAPKNSPQAETSGSFGKVQSEIISDPQLMNEMQDVLQDEEVKSILSDQEFLNDVMSMDQNKIQNNENYQKLLNHPAMQQLLNDVTHKFSNQQQ